MSDNQDQQPINPNQHDKEQAQALQNAARDVDNPNSEQGESLESVNAQLLGENQFLKEQLAEQAKGGLSDATRAAIREVVQQERQLPDPTTVTDAEYFQNRDIYIRQHGIRRPKFGL